MHESENGTSPTSNDVRFSVAIGGQADFGRADGVIEQAANLLRCIRWFLAHRDQFGRPAFRSLLSAKQTSQKWANGANDPTRTLAVAEATVDPGGYAKIVRTGEVTPFEGFTCYSSR